MFKKTTGGFTLIELLVVIAVIGILASVVLASLNSARNKAKIVSMKANLKNAVTQGELYFANNGTYLNICAATGEANDSVVQGVLNAIRAQGAEARCYVGAATVAGIDWGIGVIYDTNTFLVSSPQGVMTLDTVNTGTSQDWDTAISACASAGKRLSSFSGLKAIWDIKGTGGVGGLFSQDRYWSPIVDPSDTNNAYNVSMTTGTIGIASKSTLYRVRCGQ